MGYAPTSRTLLTTDGTQYDFAAMKGIPKGLDSSTPIKYTTEPWSETGEPVNAPHQVSKEGRLYLKRQVGNKIRVNEKPPSPKSAEDSTAPQGVKE